MWKNENRGGHDRGKRPYPSVITGEAWAVPLSFSRASTRLFRLLVLPPGHQGGQGPCAVNGAAPGRDGRFVL
jgi:hypothetical protein